MALTQEWLSQKLNSILEGLNTATREDMDKHGWYRNLIVDDELKDAYKAIDYTNVMNIEDALAIEAVKYPELFPVLREIVEKLSYINDTYWDGPIDVDSEWAAGAFFGTRLVLASEAAEDIDRFAYHLSTRDPDHEESTFQFFGFYEILRTFGYCEKTMPLLLGLFFTNSQHRDELFSTQDCAKITAYLKEGDNLGEFLALFAKWTKEYNSFSSVESVFYIMLDDILGLDGDYDLAEELAEKYEEAIEEGTVPTKEMILEWTEE